MPTPDPFHVAEALRKLLSKPQYAALLSRRNEFRNPRGRDGEPSLPETPESIAKRTAEDLWKYHPLLDPVEVCELPSGTELYRTHDGGAEVRFARTEQGRLYKNASTATTLGSSWVERSVVETIWKATSKYPAAERPGAFMDFMRTSNFVLPEWNKMLFVVCMTVPAGSNVVVLRGRGDWKAMRTRAVDPRHQKGTALHTAADVMKHEKMMPIPGLPQCVVPLLNDLWIQPVNPNSSKWPLYT